MRSTAVHNNPFAMMIDPQTVLAAIERSPRLGRLQSQVHRPLDKPLIPKVGDELVDFDDEVDGAHDD